MENSKINEICDEEIIENDDEEEVIFPDLDQKKKHEKIQHENQTAVSKFFNDANLAFVNAITPSYYGGLLTWALHQYLQRKEWIAIKTLGYKNPEPIYTNVDTSDGTTNLLTNGYLLVEKDGLQFAIMVYINPEYRGYVQIQGLAEKKDEMQGYVDDILNIVKEENFYRGKTIKFSGKIHFIKSQERSWDSIILDEEIKKEIQANTTDFLRHGELWTKCGIPLKRGVILAGEPGVGKTIICKALISESKGITCITTDPYALNYDDYVTELYEVAKDLKPSIVFIEDIDCIGQSRIEFGHHSHPALLTLLDVLDGVEDQVEVVTIATTNCLEFLDKALSERPSRFDRVIKLTRPSIEQRRELIRRLSQKIPLAIDIQDYIARKSENFTPAQIQEILFSLVIQHPEMADCDKPLSVNMDTVDKIIARINNNFKAGLGFRFSNNGHKPDSAFSINQGGHRVE